MQHFSYIELPIERKMPYIAEVAPEVCSKEDEDEKANFVVPLTTGL
jgi:hypothetical protein